MPKAPVAMKRAMVPRIAGGPGLALLGDDTARAPKRARRRKQVVRTALPPRSSFLRPTASMRIQARVMRRK